jgi:hypothetical protein
MNNLMRTLVVIALMIFSSGAWAGSGTLVVTPGVGATLKEVTDGSGNLGPTQALCDGVALANCTAVKAASTSPAATDPAVVVAISPNSLGCAGASIANTVSTPISLTAGGTLISGTASQKLHICQINIISATAQNVALVEGTGTVCATSTAGIMGGATAATGWNFAANGGIQAGNGQGMVGIVATTADNICLLSSSTGQISGNIITASY